MTAFLWWLGALALAELADRYDRTKRLDERLLRRALERAR